MIKSRKFLAVLILMLPSFVAAQQIPINNCDGVNEPRAKLDCINEQLDRLGEEKLALEKSLGVLVKEPQKTGLLDPLGDLVEKLLTQPQNWGVEVFRSTEEDGRPAVF